MDVYQIIHCFCFLFFLMIRRPPRSTRTDTSFPTRRSSDLVAYSWGEKFLQPGDEVLISHMEHHARSEEHTSELQSLMRISYAVFCLKKKIKFLLIIHTASICRSQLKINNRRNTTIVRRFVTQ